MTTALPTDDLDRQDMLQLAAGHAASLNPLMDRHAQRLFHYLVRILGSEEDADEIAQESFARVYHHREQFEANRRFSTWLYSIASNLARDRLRWRKRHPETSLDATSPATGEEFRQTVPDRRENPREVLEIEERGDLVRRAIQDLPEELRVPLVLAEYEGHSHADIGAILNCSAKAVEMRIYRARHELRDQLAPLLT